MPQKEIKIVDLGRINYGDALKEQLHYVDLVNTTTPDTAYILLCEHNHVYTLGLHGKENNLLVNADFLKKIDAEYYKIDRGGDITYHGPGQLTVYPILNLDRWGLGVKQYIHNIEESIIRLVARYGITAGRVHGATGVWIGNSKICAIGVKVSHFVTRHGLALNVNTDLKYFSYINPCGFVDKTVCSIASLTGKEIDFTTVKQQFAEEITRQLIIDN